MPSTCGSNPGSTEPERVAITAPSSGVNPIEVSALAPAWIAVTETPEPMWQQSIRMSSVASSSARQRAADWHDRPWKR